MSFILDALKKSEADRQQQTGAEFSDVPSSSGEPQSFKWLWILALILLVNLVVLLGILLRPAGSPETPAPMEQEAVEQPAAAPEPAAEPSFEDRVAEAKSSQPAETAAEEPPVADAASADFAPVETAPAEAATSPGPDRPYMKTIDELRLDGVLQLPELHIDIHVYAEEPAERFVFINMIKQTENSRLPQGPVVKEIRTDGVVLEHQGLTFLLPRE